MKAIDLYYLRLYKASNGDLRVSRNSAVTLRCPSSLKRDVMKHDFLYLVGSPDMTKFVIVGLSYKPFAKVSGVYDVRGNVDERLKFKMRMDMDKHMFRSAPLIDDMWLNAIDIYLENKSFFS